MTASHDEILAYAMGDATPEVATHVKRAIQSDPACARVYQRSVELTSVAAGQSKRMDQAFDAAFAASLDAVRAKRTIPVVPVRRALSLRPVSTWGSLAAAACVVVVGSLFAFAPAPRDNAQVASQLPLDAPVSFVAFGAATPTDALSQNAFASLASGVSAVKSGGTVSIAHGTSAETLRIDKPVRLVASDGPVIIGIRNS